MLTIANDPAGITGLQRFPWNFDLTMQENIAAHLDGGGDCELSINGLRVDPLKEPRLDKPPSIADFVTVARRPRGFETWAYIAIAALAIYTYTQIPKTPGLESPGKQSSNNALTGQTNIARVYQAVPDAYGFRRLYPDLIQPSVEEYIDNIRHVTEWLCVSRGKGTVTAVQYADTPIADIGGSSVEIFEPDAVPNALPELNDTTLLDVVEAFRSPQVDGIELNFEVPTVDYIQRVGSVTTSSADIYINFTFTDGPVWDYMKSIAGTGETVLIDVSPGHTHPYFPADLLLISYQVIGANVKFVFDNISLGYTDGPFTTEFILLASGAPTSVLKGPFVLPVAGDGIQWNTVFLRGLKGTVNIEVKWWQVDDDGVEIPGTDETALYPYIADTFDQKFYTNKVTPAAGYGRYAITFERTNGELGDGSDVAKLEAVFATRSYATKTLPGVTVVKVVSKAVDNSAGRPERKFNLRWRRHVREFASDAISASRNFARAMVHIWALAGNDVADIDTDALEVINDDLGEDSELLRFDGTFDDADISLGERMQQVAFHARCEMWRDGTKWTVTRDQRRLYPRATLDYRNLAAGGESAISYAAHLPASNDGVEIEYVDEVTMQKKAYVSIDVSSGAPVLGASARPLKIQMPGCCTEGQALNRAHLEARRLLYQRTSVQDTALADAGSLGVGGMVRWIDPNDFGGDDGLQAGEVMAIDTPGLKVATSEPIDFKGESSGRILFTGTDGLNLGSPLVCTPVAGNSKAVALASIPVGLFVRDGTTRQLGSRYAFAVGLTEAEVEAAGLFIVKDLRPGSDRTVGLSMVNYDDRLYEED